MRPFRIGLAVGVVCLASLCAAQQIDEATVTRILGAQWKQVSRTAGRIFTGTVLDVETPPLARRDAVTTIQVQFRVDRAIAGVRRGEVLSLREWVGAWSMHRPMQRGQRLLVFLYPTSSLGLTSPVGASLGLFALDAKGEVVSRDHAANEPKERTKDAAVLSLSQLERAILHARED